jgi:hypothetical protein
MSKLAEFQILLKEPVQWAGAIAPEDPLGELTAFEMALKRFCFEQNRRVLIEVGHRSMDVYLTPDIRGVLDELPSKVGQVARGEAAFIGFPESQFNLAFEPMGNEIKCILSKYGQSVNSERFMLDTTQVLTNLRHFLQELIDLAVTQKYIISEQGNAFLAPAQ